MRGTSSRGALLLRLLLLVLMSNARHRRDVPTISGIHREHVPSTAITTTTTIGCRYRPYLPKPLNVKLSVSFPPSGGWKCFQTNISSGLTTSRLVSQPVRFLSFSSTCSCCSQGSFSLVLIPMLSPNPRCSKDYKRRALLLTTGCFRQMVRPVSLFFENGIYSI